jgi:drug/metabolite transporter (DMT)-like permease
MNTSALAEARKRHRKISYAWGFRWAFLMAIAWAASMIPSGAAWYETPLGEIPLLIGAVLLTAISSVFILIFILIWLASANKLREYWLTLKNLRKVSSWYFLAAVLGGPIAYFGLYLAMGYVGPVFSILASLMYPVVGSIAARIWYKEKIGIRCALGMATIILGAIFLYAPDIIKEFSSGAGNWLGYLGGIMTAVGWGLEGAVAGRVLDVTDSDVGVAIRYTAEPIYWFLIIIPLINFQFPIWNAAGQALSNGTLLILIMLTGIVFSWTYLAWYKSFPLVGVARGQAISSTSGLFCIVFTAVFTLVLPSWQFIIAAALTICGASIMVTEGSAELEVIRNLESSG